MKKNILFLSITLILSLQPKSTHAAASSASASSDQQDPIITGFFQQIQKPPRINPVYFAQASEKDVRTLDLFRILQFRLN